MKCLRCNYELQQDALFCSHCGAAVEEKQIVIISLQCKMCGGELSVDSDNTILACPYCGSKELVIESDAVKIEKIKNTVSKEIELEKIRFIEKQQRTQQETELKREKQELAENFKESKLGKFLIVAFIISLLLIYFYFSAKLIWAGILTTIQAGCFGTAWLMGMQIIKEKRSFIHIILTIIGVLLIVPVLKYIIYL